MKNDGIRRQGVDKAELMRSAAYVAGLQAGERSRLRLMGLGGVEPPTSRLLGGENAQEKGRKTRTNRTPPPLRLHANLLNPLNRPAAFAIWRRQDVDSAPGFLTLAARAGVWPEGSC